MLKEIFTVQGEEGERKGETRRHCKGEKEVERGVMSAGEQTNSSPGLLRLGDSGCSARLVDP